jgi:hypothetical protein
MCQANTHCMQGCLLPFVLRDLYSLPLCQFNYHLEAPDTAYCARWSIVEVFYPTAHR